MATKKDLVEAYSFSRRRLVTAFVSGAPGGREVEPTRPGRTIIGGIALAVLLVAGALVLGILKSPSTVDWSKEGLISEKGTGADYVNIAPQDGGEPQLRPIINITSAMLLLGADVTSTEVDKEDIAGRDKGGTIGILQAPTTPPDVGNLIQSGWTACTSSVDGAAAGIRARISTDAGVTATPDGAFAVKTEKGDYYLIAESTLGWDRPEPRAYAFAVTARANAVLQSVAGVGDQDAVLVPQDWVALFPPGRDLSLDTFGLSPKALKRVSGLAGDGVVPPGTKIGTILADQVTGDQFVLLKSTALRLDPFSQAVYVGAFPEGDTVPTAEINGSPSDVSAITSLDGAFWPSVKPTERPSGSLCAVLDAVPGQAPGVRLARADPGSVAQAEGTTTGDSDATVDPGTGALISAADFDGTGVSSLYLIDDRGFAHRVRADEERQRLGYGEVPTEVVPSSWVGLFEDGVLLSIDAARCPPTTKPQADDGVSCSSR